MIRLTAYEFEKMVGRKVFVLISGALVLMLLMRFALLCESEKQYDAGLYQEVREGYQGMPYEEALRKVRSDSDRMSILGVKDALEDAGKSKEEIGIILSEMYGDRGSYEEFLNEDPDLSGMNEENRQEKSRILNLLRTQYEYIGYYDRFISGLPGRAEQLRQVRVFSGENSYSYRVIEKSMKDYGRLGNVSITPDYDFGVLALSEFDWSFVFTAALLLIGCAVLITDETDSRLMDLQLSTKQGRVPLALAKWFTLVLYGLLISLFISIGRVILAGSILGFGDTGRSLQSVSAFRNCCRSLTVRQWLRYTILFPAFISILTGTVILALFSMLKKAWMAAIPAAVWIVSGVILYRAVPDNSALNCLKYINLSVLADPGKRFSAYENCCLFGFPVSVLPAVSAVYMAAAILFLALYLTSFSGVLRVWIPHVRLPRKTRLRGTVRQSFQEMYRFLVQGWGCVTLIGLVVFFLSQMDYGEIHLSQEDYHYYAIGRMIGGEITDETEERLHQIQQDYVMSERDEIRIRQDAFERVFAEYRELLPAREKGVPVYYISKVITDPVFSRSRHFLLFGLLLAIVLSISFNPLFSEDQDTGLAALVRTTKNGRAATFKQRYLVMLTMYTIGFFGYMTPYLILWIRRTHMDAWDAPIQSITVFSGCEGNLSVRAFIVLWVISSWLSGMVFPVLMSYLSLAIKRKGTTLMAAAALTAADFLMNILHVPLLSVLAVSGAYGLMQVFPETGFTGIIYIIMAKNLLLLVFLLGRHWTSYCG